MGARVAGTYDLTGRVAAVTGASRGLGAATASIFAQAGARVALLGRTAHHLEQQVEAIGAGALPIVTDVRNPDDVRRAFSLIDEQFGRLDILVNNAASMTHALVHEATDEEIDSVVGTNFLGPIYATRAAVPMMQRAGGGNILNVSTDGTLFPEAPYLGLYVASKTGLDMFSRVSYQELKSLGIRVTLIIPGAMEAREPGPVPANGALRDVDRTAKVVQALDDSGYLTLLRQGSRAHYEDVVDAMLYAISAPANCAIDVIRVRPFPNASADDRGADASKLGGTS
jgi:NAD(P)-dependent dehydrogenase (short-subunit alcohol dehydrogenase family)